MRPILARPVFVALLAGLAIPSSLSLSRPRQEAPSVEEWREDLDVFREGMRETHEDLFHTLSEEAFESSVTELERRLPELERHEIIVELARIVASVGDGHSRLWLTPNERNGFRQLPILLYRLKDGSGEDGLYVIGVDARHTHILGGRVVGIDDTPVEEAWRRVSEVVHRDNGMGVASIAPRYLAIPEVLAALGISGSTDGVTFEVETPRGMTARARLDAIPDSHLSHLSNQPFFLSSEGDRVEFAMANAASGPPPPWLRRPTDRRWMEWLPAESAEERTLYIQLNAIANGPDESMATFFERAFTEAARNEPERLVLDLRLNGGGNNFLNFPILEGLWARPELNRRGRLFVIIGRHTFSAASHLVTHLERFTEAIFVGEPTGGSPNHYGDAAPVDLPNSGLRVGASTIYWQNSVPKEFESRRWTPPEVAAELTIDDFMANRDPALEAIRAWEPEPPLAEQVADALEEGGREAGRVAYRAFMEDPRHAYLDAESGMNALGYRLLRNGRAEDAVLVFRLNAEAYPESANVFDSLGDGYLALGDTARAIESYRQALEVDPGFNASLRNLARLTGGG